MTTHARNAAEQSTWKAQQADNGRLWGALIGFVLGVGALVGVLHFGYEAFFSLTFSGRLGNGLGAFAMLALASGMFQLGTDSLCGLGKGQS